MALTDRAGLLSGLAAFSVRGDQDALWPLCIELAEAEFNRTLAEKAVRPMIARATTTVDETFETPPVDLLRPVSFQIYSDEARTDLIGKLDYVAPENLDRMKADRVSTLSDCVCAVTGTTEPAWYTLKGSEIEFWPVPTSARYGELLYVQKIPALSEENTSNWLLERHPDAYLYGALVQFAMSTEDERMGVWTQAYERAVGGVLRAYPTETNKARLRTDLPLSRYC